MDGTIFFGRHSIDIASWNNERNISKVLDILNQLVGEINNSGYAKVSVPANWTECIIDGDSFFDAVSSIIQGQSDLLGYILANLFDKVFNSCVDKSVQFEHVAQLVSENNPNTEKEEYYGVLKTERFWPNISESLHVSNNNELHSVALKFLSEQPKNEISFAYRCRLIFSNLIFHEEFEKTLTGHGTISKRSKYGKAPTTGIAGFSISVTRCLDTMNSINLEDKNTKDILAEIQALSGIECSPEGGKNSHLKFSFENDASAIDHVVNCEFHAKIHANNADDGVYYQDRLYFGFAHIDGIKRIVIAHSGAHL